MPYKACASCGAKIGNASKRCRHCGAGKPSHNGKYLRVYAPGHPLAGRDGYLLEHRKVLYDAGVTVPEGAHVHHINEDTHDNRLDNLAVVNVRDHAEIHIARRGRLIRNQHGEWRSLSPKEREQIIERLAHGEFANQIAAEYGVRPFTVSRLRRIANIKPLFARNQRGVFPIRARGGEYHVR